MNYRAISIHLTRAVYAMNWFTISPGLIFIEKDLSLTSVQIGFLVTAFYIGVGVFQIPAGYLATRFGSRNIASLGMFILGLSGILCFLSPSYYFLVGSRLLAGLSAAMFFSPAIGTLRNTVSEESYSFHVNLFNGVFSIGAATGIFGWEFLDESIGWRPAFLIAGLVTIAFAILFFFSLMSVKEEKSSRTPFKTMINVLKNKLVWIFAFAGTAAVISENVAAVLVTYYLETVLHVSKSLASVSGTLFLAFGFVGGMIGAVVVGKRISAKSFFILTTLLTSLLMLVVGFIRNLYAIYALFSVLGAVSVEVFSAIYVLISKSLPERAETTSSMSVVNGIQEIPGSVWPYVFTLVSASTSFTFSWVLVGVISLAFLGLVFLPAARKVS